ncbi:MAG TPA: hypothetical protein VH475_17100 [Tepidisphaeraceae bacterium]|jgi:hypothetical protein
MRRLLRILLNVATVVSLVLCAATVVVWVRSCWRIDELQILSADHHEAIHTYPHGIWFVLGTNLPDWPGTTWQSRPVVPGTWFGQFDRFLIPTVQRTTRPFDKQDYYRFLGFVYADAQYPSTMRTSRNRYVGVPLYFVLILTIALPAVRLWKRSRRPRPGTCARCGYDLRATPERCPECGQVRCPP